MCALVAQGWVPHEIERILNDDPDYGKLERLVDNPDRTFTEVLIDIGAIKPEDNETITHLNRHWLASDKHAWWPHHPNKGEVLRQGLMRTIQAAAERQLPVGIYWICAGPQFQCVLGESDSQVTLMLLTPPIPNATAQPPSTEEEPLRVIGNKADIDYIVDQAALYGGRPTKEDCRPLAPGYDIWEARVFSEARDSS
jgi:hypothetical protein